MTQQFNASDDNAYLSATDFVVGRAASDPRASTVKVGARLVRTEDGDFVLPSSTAAAETFEAAQPFENFAVPNANVRAGANMAQEARPAPRLTLPARRSVGLVAGVLVLIVGVALVVSNVRRGDRGEPPALLPPGAECPSPNACLTPPTITVDVPPSAPKTPVRALLGPPLVIVVRDCFPLECGADLHCFETTAQLQAFLELRPSRIRECVAGPEWGPQRQRDWQTTH